MSRGLRLAAMMSGGGRTVLNIADAIDRGELNASIELVIASRGDVAGVDRTRARGLKTIVLARRDFAAENDLHDAVTAALLDHRIDLVCLAGYLKPVRVDEPFRWRMMNIHPALLPEFGGKGMYGDRVHEAVLAAGRTESGCTVHFVDEHYDRGPIILQRTCPVLRGDTAHTLAARVFEEECIAYPAAIRLFGEGRLRVEGNRVIILPPPSNAAGPVGNAQ